MANIGKYLPEFWSKGNPVDLVGTRNLEAPAVAVEELMKWDGINAVICLGVVGRHELVKQLLESTRKADPEVTVENDVLKIVLEGRRNDVNVHKKMTGL